MMLVVALVIMSVILLNKKRKNMKKCYNGSMHKNFTRGGFTLIELSLSIVFISVLSLAVALLIMNAIAAYRRGIVLNRVNDVGAEIVDDMRASIQSATIKTLEKECERYYNNDGNAAKRCENDKAKKFSSNVYKADVLGVGDGIPVSGIFCTGKYTYIWRSGYLFEGNGHYITKDVTFVYEGETGPTLDKDFKLLKVEDTDRIVCKMMAGYEQTGGKELEKEIDVSGAERPFEEAPVDLLSGNDMLALYDLSITTNMGQKKILHTVSFMLGTEQGSVNISGSKCAAPEENDYLDYCAINKFNFVAQANGG